MGVVSLSLDKNDASLRFKMKGFDMPMKYWAEELTDLPVSERDGKFNVHYIWGDPNSPVAVYRGDAFICDAMPQGRVDFIEAQDGVKVVAREKAKGKHIKQRRNAIKAAKACGSVALPDGSAALTLPPMVAPSHALVIAPSTKVRAVAAPVSPLRADPDHPGEYINTETGKRYRGDAAQFEQERQEQVAAAEAEQVTTKRLEKLRQTQEALRDSAYLQG
jgi:hypothetical protein